MDGKLRSIDELGRIVLPSKIRSQIGLSFEDEVDISISGTDIILKKVIPSCIFCNSEDDIIHIRNHYVCKKCCVECQKLIAGGHNAN